jgi:hypothetical protein
MLSIGALSLRVPVRRPTLISLDLPLTALIGIAGKRKQFLTYTHETIGAKLEWLRSARLIHGDQQITTRHANALFETKGLISLPATSLSPISLLISQVKFINMRTFASYSKHAEVSKQYWLSSHDYKVVVTPNSYHHIMIMMLIILRLDAANEPPPHPRVSWRFESIVNLARV